MQTMMPPENDASHIILAQVQRAIETKKPLYIHGGKSKTHCAVFNDVLSDATHLDVSQHTGVVSYEPSELAITVRAGTRLSDLESLLAENHQILPFEPPHHTEHATIGGAIATGISGPRRAYSGSARDTILGVTIINGEGEIAHFGGEVMKNVAGYDLSRLMVRSFGTLGVILDVSLRLLPKPAHESTLVFETDQQNALAYFQLLRKQQQIITATAWLDQQCYMRLSGSEKTVNHFEQKLTGSPLSDAPQFWQSLRDRHHSFFQDANEYFTTSDFRNYTKKPMWRLSLPPATPVLQSLDDHILIEWGGAQRWVNTNTPANIIQSIAKKHHGYATLISGNLPEISPLPKLDTGLFVLHKRLKNKMDPQGIFNPGRLYEGL